MRSVVPLANQNHSPPFFLKCFFWMAAAVVIMFQLIQLDRPFAGHFGSYQAVMASMARGFLQEHFLNFFMPSSDLILEGKRSLHLNQLPLSSHVAAFLSLAFGLSLEVAGRLQSILLHFLSCFFIYHWISQLSGRTTAYITCIIYLLSPFTVIYGQSFMSESLAQAFFIGALLLFTKAIIEGRPVPATIAGILFSIALCNRLHLLCFYPVFAVLALCCGIVTLRKRIVLLIAFFVGSSVAVMAWYGFTYWATKTYDHVHTSLFMQVAASQPFIHYIQDFNFLKVLLWRFFWCVTPVFFFSALAGLRFFSFKCISCLVFIAGLIGVFGVIVLAPRKIIDHEFYFYGFIPFAAFFAASVLERFSVLSRPKLFAVIFLAATALSVRYFFNPLFRVSADERLQVSRGRVADQTLPKDIRVVVAGNQVPIFDYYVNRAIWNFAFDAVGKDIAGYARNGRMDATRFEAIQAARKDALSWFKHLEGEGAEWVVFYSAEDFNHYEDLKHYIERTYVFDDAERDGLIVFKKGYPYVSN